ncbi:hypothetical protein G7Y79_00006g018380 [Physcia stellaris]|nr:hypothetical protein G7Y79_00006g018380 [Physcia stellaris]
MFLSATILLLALATTTLASPYPLTPRTSYPSCTPHPNNTTPHPRALYLLTNSIPQNSIISLRIAPNGLLSPGSTTPTGGRGGAGLDSTTNKTAETDVLFSQSALRASGRWLVAVNAGSNTLSLFRISRTDATVLIPVGAPVDTGGEFPVSVALKRGLACVANSGARAGVACFSVHATRGLIPLSRGMLIEFPELAQSTPPRGPLNSVSHTLFSEDGRTLITVVKGDPGSNSTRNPTGFLSLLPISARGRPEPEGERRASPNGTAVLFGSAIIPGKNELFATDASFGAVTLSLPAPGGMGEAPKVLAKTTIANQTATCWATYSPYTCTAFVTDVAMNRLVEIAPSTGVIKQIMNLPNGNFGMVDFVADKGGLVYALSPGFPGFVNGTAAVVVVDVRGRGEAGAGFWAGGLGEGDGVDGCWVRVR